MIQAIRLFFLILFAGTAWYDKICYYSATHGEPMKKRYRRGIVKGHTP